jgi:hypothetical protein
VRDFDVERESWSLLVPEHTSITELPEITGYNACRKYALSLSPPTRTKSASLREVDFTPVIETSAGKAFFGAAVSQIDL